MRESIFITVAIFFSLVSIQAQELVNGSLGVLKSETKIHVVIDYSDVVIDQMTEAEFIEYQCTRGSSKWGDKWEQRVKPDLFTKFTGQFNLNFIGKSELRSGNFSEASYWAVVKLVNIDKYGTVDARVVITKANSTEPIATIKLRGDGGLYGSRENLMGDGFKRAGAALGKFLAKELL